MSGDDNKNYDLQLLAKTLRNNEFQVEIFSDSEDAVNFIAFDTGEIVNIDSKGNRISGSLYYADEIFFVIGKNKIADNLEGAIFRARNVAAPKNSKAHNYRTPCTKTGKCEKKLKSVI